MTRKQALIFAILSLVMAVPGVVLLKDALTGPQATTETTKSAVKQPPAFNKHLYSTSNPASIWVVVNKQHPLSPKSYVPASLVIPGIPLRSNITGDEEHVSSVMAPALESMVAAARKDGLTINLQSGYRSYNLQVSLYGSYVHRDGQAAADTYSARPGFSEHQTGLAADLGGTTAPACNVEDCFGTTPEGRWLAKHAYQYGFIIRYTTAKQSITGYENEPWHVRYVGTLLSAEMHKEHIATLEEFFGVGGGVAY